MGPWKVWRESEPGKEEEMGRVSVSDRKGEDGPGKGEEARRGERRTEW